jgi:hypothetical protein
MRFELVREGAKGSFVRLAEIHVGAERIDQRHVTPSSQFHASASRPLPA